ncbi:MAG: hypothetical protein WCR30_04730 [Clostridia bacterium]
MAKYKFDPQNTSEELIDYFNVNNLSRKQIKELQQLPDKTLEEVLKEMPYLAEHLSLNKLFNIEGNVIEQIVSNQDSVRALSVNQKFVILEDLIKKDPTNIFDIPNKKLNKMASEDRIKIISDSAISMLKDEKQAFNNIKSLSEHLVKNGGLFGRKTNFGSEIFNSVIDSVNKKDISLESLNTFFSATTSRLMEIKGKKQIVEKAIDTGISLSSIPAKLRSENIIYRAIMNEPKDIQYTPNPVTKTMFQAFVNATSRKIVQAKSDPSKYIELLTQIIKEKKLSINNKDISLNKNIKEKFIAKTIINASKKNPALFIQIGNMENLGFSKKTILANKIVAVKNMSVTNQKKYFNRISLSNLLELSENMKKLPPVTKNNLISAIKALAPKQAEIDASNKIVEDLKELGNKATKEYDEAKNKLVQEKIDAIKVEQAPIEAQIAKNIATLDANNKAVESKKVLKEKLGTDLIKMGIDIDKLKEEIEQNKAQGKPFKKLTNSLNSLEALSEKTKIQLLDSGKAINDISLNSVQLTKDIEILNVAKDAIGKKETKLETKDLEKLNKEKQAVDEANKKIADQKLVSQKIQVNYDKAAKFTFNMENNKKITKELNTKQKSQAKKALEQNI